MAGAPQGSPTCAGSRYSVWGSEGLWTLAQTGKNSEAAWEEAQDYRGTKQAGFGSRALTAGL